MRAPRGGIVIGLHFYPGGRFIPDQALRADPAAGRKMAAARAAASASPAADAVAAGLAHLPEDMAPAAQAALDRVREAHGRAAAGHVLGLLRSDLTRLAHGAAADEDGRNLRLRVAAECWMLERAAREEWTRPVSMAAGRREFSCAMVNLPPKLAAEVLALGSQVPEDELAEDGRELCPHVTVKYGPHTNDPGEVAKVLQGAGPVGVRLGRLAVFSNEQDVLVAEVDSPDLVRLNRRLADRLEHTDTHPDCRPHVTVARLKKGKGAKYVGRQPFGSPVFTAGTLVFSPAKGGDAFIALDGTAGVALAVRHAPRGGVKLKGREYAAGEFLPGLAGETAAAAPPRQASRKPAAAAKPPERLGPDQLFERHPDLPAILAPVKDAADNAAEQDVLDRAVWEAERRLTGQHKAALRAAGFGLGDGLDLQRAAGAAHHHANLYDRAHLAELAAIPVDQARRVGGVMVRRQGPAKYRVETERGYVAGDARKVAEHIAAVGKQAGLYGRRLQEALDRAAGHEEPSFMEAERLDEAARAFEALPAGAAVVSLDADAGSYGRTGRIVKDELGRNRVVLEGEAGYASSHVEPLDARRSWRAARPAAELSAEPSGPAAEAPRQGFLFSLWRRLRAS